MPVDLRCKHDREVRERAADLFAAGRGSKSVARELRVPEGAVRKWLLEVCQDFGHYAAR